jgi:DNA helicase-2/ATP-dependent DNA helicase PcrA
MLDKGLNQAQSEAVRFDKNRPLMILAGAGSGKTRVLTHRAAYFIENESVDPQNILLLTFTNKAAGEMMSRVNQLTKTGGVGISGGTFHSFCLKLLRRYGQEIGTAENFSVFDEDDQIEVIKKSFQLLSIDPKSTKPRAVLATISDAKNNLVEPKDYVTYARGTFQQMVARVYPLYQNLLKRYNGMDFDDLLTTTVKLLRENRQVHDKVTNKFQFILIDEYQDTNKVQYELTKLLALDNQRLTVVGDAAQAIYSWRGADYKNLLYLKQDFPTITMINLEQNYRSTQNILSAANQIISKNKNHPILRLWTSNGKGQKIEIFQANDEAGEAEYVTERVREETKNGKSLSDFAVLYRTNAQSRIIEEAFLHAGIAYRLFGGIRFYERREIKDVLAYLRLLVNPADEVSKTRAEKIGKTRLRRLEASREEIDIKKPTLEILDLVIKQTQYLDQFEQENEEDMMRLENIKELRSVATQFPELSEFLQQIALSEKEAGGKKTLNNDNAGMTVTMMTAHSAKGLEFDTVFMVGMEEGLFPHSRALMDAEQMEEERRLCYVGMTRAKNMLHMSFARKRLYFGQRNSNAVSRFLSEIPEDLVISKAKINKFKSVGSDWGFDEKGEWKWNP